MQRPPRVCRFCLDVEHEHKESDFVDDPCLCRGSCAAVHLRCLEKHFVTRGQWHNFKCPTCTQPYQGKALHKLAHISLEEMIRTNSEYSLEIAHSLCYLALAYSQLGNPAESKKLLERRLLIEEQLLGIGHVVTASTLSDLAAANGKLGNIKVQKELLERSLSIKEAHYGAGHIGTAIVLNNLATAYNELGEPLRERDLLEKSLAIKERHYGKGNVHLAATLVNLAGVYSELGDAARSCKLLKDTLAIEEQHYGVGHLETAITLNNLAFACGEMGDLQEMRLHLQQSLSIKERHYGKNHFESSLTLSNLGLAHCALKEMALAKECINAALLACNAASPLSRRRAAVFLNAAAIHRFAGEVSLAEDFAIRASQVMCENMGVTAAAKALKLERTRIASIWSDTGRNDVMMWLENFLEHDIYRLDSSSVSTCISSTMSTITSLTMSSGGANHDNHDEGGDDIDVQDEDDINESDDEQRL